MNSIRNDVNGTGTPCEGRSSGRNLMAQQHEPDRNPATARKMWSKNNNKLAMMSYFKSEPLKRGYRKRMLEIWKEIGTFDLKEQQLADQVRSIRKNRLISEVEMEELKRKVEGDGRENSNDEETTFEEENPVIVNEIPDTAIDEPVETEDEIITKLKSIMRENPKCEVPHRRHNDRGRLASEKVKGSLAMKETNNMDEIRDLIHAGASLVPENLGVKRKPGVEKEPYWKRHIESDIKRLRKDLSRIEDWFKGRWTKKGTRQKQESRKRSKLKEKGFKLVMEELKKRIKAKAFKVKRYTSRI